MNLLKSRRSSASAAGLATTAQQQRGCQPALTSDGTGTASPAPPWRNMGGENSAFKSLIPQVNTNNNSDLCDNQNGGGSSKYASSETSEEINVTTDDEDSNLSNKYNLHNREEQKLIGFNFVGMNGPLATTCEDLAKLAQTDMRASIESWREMAVLNTFRKDHQSGRPTPASQPLQLTKYDRDRVL